MNNPTLSKLALMLPTLVPLAFPLMWIGVLLLLAKVGGWSKLAEHYGARDVQPTQTWAFRSARVGFVNYNNVLTFGVTQDGLLVRMFMLFRPGHAPFVIPWRELTVTVPDKPSWLVPRSTLVANRCPELTIRIADKLASEIADAQRRAT